MKTERILIQLNFYLYFQDNKTLKYVEKKTKEIHAAFLMLTYLPIKFNNLRTDISLLAIYRKNDNLFTNKERENGWLDCGFRLWAQLSNFVSVHKTQSGLPQRRLKH